MDKYTQDKYLVASAGLEPASPVRATDFKSVVYADSTTRLLCVTRAGRDEDKILRIIPLSLRNANTLGNANTLSQLS